MTTEQTAGRMARRCGIVSGTGRRGGTSQAVARRLVGEGASITTVDHDPAAEGFAKELQASHQARGMGGDIRAVIGDLRDPSTAAEAVAQHAEEFGGLDFVVNVAGGSSPGMPMTVADTKASHFEVMMETNLLTAVNLTTAALPLLRETPDRSAVITFGSVNGSAGWGFALEPAYAAANGALASWTLALAAEVKRHGVLCNHIRPASIINPHSPTWAQRLDDPAVRHHLRALYDPFGFITAEQIASLVVFLLDALSPPITGQEFVIDCGIGRIGTRDIREDGRWYLPLNTDCPNE
ncbi:MAG: SDR family oxidoreductase [Planctomycetes bacterium]|nr:SDR family oxidoreductase [Planctomycetota bacterium]